MKNKKMRQRILSVLLVCALIITGAFAFLSATDSKTNVFTVGNIDIELWENFDIDNSGTLDNDEVFYESNEVVPMTETILPGEEVFKQPYVKNTGDNDAWIFMTVSIPTAPLTDLVADANGNVNITQTGNANKNPQIVVKAYGLQDNYGGSTVTTAEGRWNALGVDVDGSYNTVADVSTRAALFSMIEIDTTNWTQIGNVYHSADGNDYYVFAYNTILPAHDNAETENITENVTTNLFNKVKLFENIGAESISNISFVNNGQTVSTEAYSETSDIVYTPNLAPLQWVAPNGRIFSSSTSRAASQYLAYEYDEDTQENIIVDANPIITALASSPTVQTPKLMPKSGSSIAVERDGFVETYNNYTTYPYGVTSSTTSTPTTTRYSAGSDGFSNYFVYGFGGTKFGVDDYTETSSNFVKAHYYNYWTGVTITDAKVFELLDEYLEIDINGTKYSLSAFNSSNLGHVTASYGVYCTNDMNALKMGTGDTITIYDNNNNIVEQFFIVLTGDANKDGRLTTADISCARTIAAGIITPSTAQLKCLDINHDGIISYNGQTSSTDLSDDIIAIRANITFVAEMDDTNQTVHVLS